MALQSSTTEPADLVEFAAPAEADDPVGMDALVVRVKKDDAVLYMRLRGPDEHDALRFQTFVGDGAHRRSKRR